MCYVQHLNRDLVVDVANSFQWPHGEKRHVNIVTSITALCFIVKCYKLYSVSSFAQSIMGLRSNGLHLSIHVIPLQLVNMQVWWTKMSLALCWKMIWRYSMSCDNIHLMDSLSLIPPVQNLLFNSRRSLHISSFGH